MSVEAVEAGETVTVTKVESTAGSSRRGALIAGVLLALLIAALAFTAVQAHRAGALNDARADAMAAAKERVPTLLSYDAATLDADLATADKQTTGKFHTDYGQILADVVKPAATARGITTSAAVNAAGVVRGDRDRVVVLLFLTQTTTAAKTDGKGDGMGDGKGDAKGNGKPTAGTGTSISGSRVEVTMKRVGDTWKIAGLSPK